MNRWNPLLELPRLRKLSYAASIMIIDRNQQRLCTYVLTLLKNSRFKCKINTKTFVGNFDVIFQVKHRLSR